MTGRECGSFTNVAEVIGDGSTVLDQDDATTTVGCLGFTMGFWGNKNGQKLLAGTNAFTNPVTLGINPDGCYVVVNSAAKSTTIFPKSLNGLSVMQNCSALDSGINKNSFNTLSRRPWRSATTFATSTTMLVSRSVIWAVRPSVA